MAFEHDASVGSHTILALYLDILPSDIFGYFLKIFALVASSSTASPRNSNLSLFTIPGILTSFAYEL